MASNSDPKFAMQGQGYRLRQDQSRESFEVVQLFFYSDGRLSGFIKCKIAGVVGIGDSPGFAWVVSGTWEGGRLQFEIVHMELRYSRDPVAIFFGDYDGEGGYGGRWESASENGIWRIQLRKSLN